MDAADEVGMKPLVEITDSQDYRTTAAMNHTHVFLPDVVF